MSKRHFYVTLLSKSSNVDFPGNKPTGFRVRLQNTVKLSGRWEVALASITYPRTWLNVVEKRNGFVLHYKDEEYKLSIPAGHYKSIPEVVDAMNASITKVLTKLNKLENKKTAMVNNTIDFTDRTGEVSVNNDDINLDFPEPSLLGPIVGSSDRPADLNTIKKLFVYTDLVEHSAVGATMVPLLRTVKVDGEFGAIVEREFVDKYYIPVVSNEFNTVEIQLGDNAGQPIAFQGGEVVIILHFKPVPGAFL